MAIKILAQQPLPDNTFMLQLEGLSSDTKPTDAFVATGSQFFEYDTDAVFSFNGSTWDLDKNGQMKDLPVVTATDNGKILKVDNGVWSIGIDSGSSLPALTGKNGKVLGVTLDSGDKEQIEWVTPSGGGAEKFVVTLTQDEQTEEWTADGRTVADIVAADAANQIVVCKVSPSGGGMPYELPLTTAAEIAGGEGYVSIFTGVIMGASGDGNDSVAVFGSYGEGQTNWLVTTTPIPDSSYAVPEYSSSNNGQVLGVSSGSLAWVDSNAPLIVTMSDDGSEGLVGDKTFSEIATAASANKPVAIKYSDSETVAVYNAISVYAAQECGQTTYQVSYIEGNAIKLSQGSANDYFVYAS